MKINTKILSIPPYISTSWKNVVSLHINHIDGVQVLIIGLVNGSTIEIPNLEMPVLKATFAAHEKFLEQEATNPPKTSPNSLLPEGFMDGGTMMSIPLNIGFDGNMGNFLQHNQDASESPDLPKEVLEQIMQISKAIGLDNADNLPKPEPHCNCMHCQIMRAMSDEEEEIAGDHEEEHEEVSDEDLRFREWDIEQSSDNLYVVTNPFNKAEHFNVFLGKPVGCTCGKPNCEHIKAVLNS